MQWSTFRTQFQRSVVKDPTGRNWTNETLLDFLHDAVKLFCSHTAVATSFTVAGDGATLLHDLPSNLYETPDKSGVVYINDGEDITTLAPVSFGEIADADETNYMVFPDQHITLFEAVPVNSTLHVVYYAIPNLPQLDTDTVPIPDWAHAAVKYMMAVYALSGPATREANIRQWGAKPDTGDPEDNSFGRPIEWFIRQYELELSKYPRQNRTSFRRGL